MSTMETGSARMSVVPPFLDPRSERPTAAEPSRPPTKSRRSRPSRLVPLDDALALAAELRSTEEEYAHVFGAAAPPARELADAFALAVAWGDEERRAETWLAYVRAQSGQAWEAAAKKGKALEAAFATAFRRDPTVAARFPATAVAMRRAKRPRTAPSPEPPARAAEAPDAPPEPAPASSP